MWLLDILVTFNVDNDCNNFPSFLLKLRQKEIFARTFVYLFSLIHRHWFREYLLIYSGLDVVMQAVEHTLQANALACMQCMQCMYAEWDIWERDPPCTYELDSNFFKDETEILFLKCKLWNRLNHKLTNYLKHIKLIYKKWKLGEIMRKDNSYQTLGQWDKVVSVKTHSEEQ